MLARDIMTKTVTTVRPDTPLVDAIGCLVDARVSGLPVLDAAGTLVGVLTEGDLLRRVETGTETTRPGWLDILLGPGRTARDYVHSHGRLVADVMTTPVVTITADTTLADAVKLMEKRHIKRLPVLDGGALVGLVSRSDIVRALGRAMRAEDAPQPGPPPTDDEIRDALLTELANVRWANAHNAHVRVEDGVVTLEGVIFTESVRPAIRVAAQDIRGVRAVDDQMIWLEPVTGTTLMA